VQIVDYVAIGLVLLFVIVGIISGFGGGLKFFTSGIFGFLIAIAVCVALVPTICGTEFVTNLLAGLNESLSGVGGDFGETLVLIVDYAIVGIILFIVVQIVRMVIVAILKHIVELDNIVFKIINKTLGVVFYLAVLVLIVAVVFSVVSVIGGDTSANFYMFLHGGEEGTGSLFKIDELFIMWEEIIQSLTSGSDGEAFVALLAL
jgi:hypothetical protein